MKKNVHFRRISSALLACCMLLCVMPVAQGYAAAGTDGRPPAVTFTVPETLWLTQGVSGETLQSPNDPQPVTAQAQTEIAAYSNITNTNGTQPTGEVFFHAAGAANLVITATQLGTAITEFGTMADASGENFSHTLAGGLRLPIAVAANTAVIIEWTATYELPSLAAGAFTSKAYSVAYAPNSNVTGAAITIQHTIQGGGTEPWNLVAEAGSTFFMAGLQNIALDPLGAKYWTLDPQRNLSDAVLAASASDAYKAMTELPFGRDIWRGEEASLMYNLTGAQMGAGVNPMFPHGITGTTNVFDNRPTHANVWLDRNIAYNAFRDNIQVSNQTQANNLKAKYEEAGGRWAGFEPELDPANSRYVMQKVGSMQLDSSRFANLGQVPGMRFVSIYPSYAGDIEFNIGGTGNTANQWRRRIDKSFGDYIRLGDYVKTFDPDAALPTGQHFSSNGGQVNITPGEGTQTVTAEAMYSTLYDVRARENAILSWVTIEIQMGVRANAGFAFDIVKTDKSALRGEALAARYPDEFYENDNAGFNDRLRMITNWLGNPLESNTDLTGAPGIDELEVNKAALNAKLAQARAIAKGKYTDNSWNALQTAITAAQAAADDGNATQAQVDAALAALNGAIDGLRELKTIFGTKYASNFWNWFAYIALFGWIWMRLVK